MKVFSIIGFSATGKTTTAEHIIRELKHRGYSVGAVKQCHHEIKIDAEGTNTDRLWRAGASTVTARGVEETHVFYYQTRPIHEILALYDQDFVIMEGVADIHVLKIVTALDTGGIDAKMDSQVFAVSGPVAEQMRVYKGIPVINGVTETQRLVDLIEEKVPGFDIEMNGKEGNYED